MQNAALRRLSLDWRYLAAEVRPEDLRAAIAGAKAMRFIGLNLTVPHKTAALEMVDVVHEKARLLGAVNTIVFETRRPQGRLDSAGPGGGRTDHRSPQPRLQHRRGRPGALPQGRFPMAGLARRLRASAGRGRARPGPPPCNWRRKALPACSWSIEPRPRPNNWLAEVTARFPAVNIILVCREMPVDLVINATSLGLKPDDPPPVAGRLAEIAAPPRVYDMIYRPAETALSARGQEARAARRPTAWACCFTRARPRWNCGRACRRPWKIMRAALRKNIYG